MHVLIREKVEFGKQRQRDEGMVEIKTGWSYVTINQRWYKFWEVEKAKVHCLLGPCKVALLKLGCHNYKKWMWKFSTPSSIAPC